MVYGTGSAGRKVRAQPGNSDAQPGISMWERLQEHDSQGTQNKDQNEDQSICVVHSTYTVYHIYRTGCTISIVDTAEFHLGISTAVLFVRKLTLPVCSVISSVISGASFLTPAESVEALVVHKYKVWHWSSALKRAHFRECMSHRTQYRTGEKADRCDNAVECSCWIQQSLVCF